MRQAAARFAAQSNLLLYLPIFTAVVLSHLTLLHLPYYWDEGGYYIPAALDFYHRFTLIPEFTNAHPPLPNVVLGSLWHVFGYHILVTRLIVCAFAAAALLAVYRLALALLDAEAALITVALTALYPIWFAQSTLAHADIFAAAFTLGAFALYLPTQVRRDDAAERNRNHYLVAILFSFAALSKETAIIEPATLAFYHLLLSCRKKRSPEWRTENLHWLLTLAAPLVPLLGWYTYHRLHTGFTFGNPEYLRYNATGNFTLNHFFLALRYRFIHLAWQRNIWFPIVTAIACLFILDRKRARWKILPGPALRIIGLLVVANWFAFSLLGGALLTRYLLPIYPLILLVCVAAWRATTPSWPALAALTATSFVIALWWSPPAAYAPEDSLTYRDMIVVHQDAISFIDEHYPDARVLTSWPAAAELYRPDLGFTDRKIMGPEIDNFSSTEIAKAAQEPEKFDTALVFSKNFVPSSLGSYLQSHSNSARARNYEQHRDLSPKEIASLLGGEVVFYKEKNGEWAAVLRFPRSYVASLLPSKAAAMSIYRLFHSTGM